MIKVAISHLKDRKLSDFEKDLDDINTFLSHTTYTHIRSYCKSFYLYDNSKKTKEFRPNITFNDITDLYYFDKTFAKELFFFLIEIERKLKSILIDIFFEESHHTVCAFDKNVFDINSNDFKDLEIKINLLLSPNQKTFKYPKGKYCLNNAFWVIIKDFSFGSITRMITALKPNHQQTVANKLNLNKNIKLKTMLKFITDFRNMLAHDEPIYIKYNYKLNITVNIHYVVLEIYNMLDSHSQVILKENLIELFNKHSISLQKHNLKTYSLLHAFLR